ncbi:MAG: aminoglycoside phosphotransferase family protein [Acidimicrobiales bacterium]
MAWSIHVGEPFQPGGQTAWVAPATRHREDLVLKVLWRHPEAEHEADGLRIWDGDGAVRLHAATEVDVQTTALLLERCRPGTTLEARPELEQDLVVAGLLRRLWTQPLPLTGFAPSSRCANDGPTSSSTRLPATPAWTPVWCETG